MVVSSKSTASDTIFLTAFEVHNFKAPLTTPGWSLGLIGNASGRDFPNEAELDPRRFR